MARDKWFFKEMDKKAQAANKEAITQASLVVVRSIKEHFPGSGIKNINKAGKAKGASKTEREANRSLAEEIPHIQTGTLKRSIGHDIVKDTSGNFEGHVGPKLGYKETHDGEVVNPTEGGKGYGFWLEVGTPKMAARPYLRPGLEREGPTILKIFNKIF